MKNRIIENAINTSTQNLLHTMKKPLNEVRNDSSTEQFSVLSIKVRLLKEEIEKNEDMFSDMKEIDAIKSKVSFIEQLLQNVEWDSSVADMEIRHLESQIALLEKAEEKRVREVERRRKDALILHKQIEAEYEEYKRKKKRDNKMRKIRL